MGIVSWFRGEPSPGDDTYDLYHRVGQQLGKSEKCQACSGVGYKRNNALKLVTCSACGGGGWRSH